ncbi:hypothetical protein GLOIN_2v1789680 [Rhizophagus irregularis DAOM 181602=DAOM 197198]|uniref:Uncharacterized protein n=1 Tax=Rhizophagus irregularis (strain DAOM 181602 / DAOM 197198 / MUCL 43194) TaxID=747089 RepID=A0A2P4P0T0_RHIID|nr:hypothetical protein GLOIN_2v1789680 [Rhizophagus irregularis DAOM 181602=DAOM 197198]POG58983.1 hypothetical protein GLOIN_2v1789680 [Rhizophagus irregularis DAOM 181602=DAOM 197198]|eukprot:XP_025165849.1 hypothetical protein GLOIN_2v1789680 [Rhizophagus irregularis DAOM 181602=DAOM 197198]
MSLIITLLLCTILSDININFIAETERKRKVKEAHLQAPIPDKSSSSIDINVQLSSPEVIKEKSASIPSKQLLKHLQIVYNIYNITIYNLINIGGNKSSTIMTRSSSTKEKNN